MLEIVKYPNKILEKACKQVAFPLSKEDQDLIKEMWKTAEGRGVGLAAPQVGSNKKICIINMKEFEDFEKPERQNILMINPKVTFYSQKENSMIEGCLSFSGQYYLISRPANIVVEYHDENGNKKILKAKKWLSRVIQHETDHLQGLLFINKGGQKIDEKDLE